MPLSTTRLLSLCNLSLSTKSSKMSAHDNEELIDYEDEGDVGTNGGTTAAGGASAGATGGEGEKDKKNFSGIHSTGFRYG